MDAVDATLTDEQRALRALARDLLAEINGVDRLRGIWDSGPRERDVWKRLAEVGLTAVGIAEEDGGGGGDASDLAVVLEEAGYAALPEPLAETVAVAAPIMAAAGDAVRAWLPRIAAGEAIIGLWLDETPWLADADVLDAVLVKHGRELRLVPREEIVVGRRVPSEDGTRRLFAATIDQPAGVAIGSDAMVGQATDRYTAAIAAQLVGVCQRLLDESVAYARIRRQFNAPIGSFQAVQHMLASMYVEIESARGAVRHAARRLALAPGDSDTEHSARVAKAAAGRAHRLVNRDALQVFGGIGFTWEHDLHLFLKRGAALAVTAGDERAHRRVLGRRLMAVSGEETFDA